MLLSLSLVICPLYVSRASPPLRTCNITVLHTTVLCTATHIIKFSTQHIQCVFVCLALCRHAVSPYGWLYVHTLCPPIGLVLCLHTVMHHRTCHLYIHSDLCSVYTLCPHWTNHLCYHKAGSMHIHCVSKGMVSTAHTHCVSKGLVLYVPIRLVHCTYTVSPKDWYSVHIPLLSPQVHMYLHMTGTLCILSHRRLFSETIKSRVK